MPNTIAKMPCNSINNITFILNNRYTDIDITITTTVHIMNSIRPHPGT